MSEKVIAVRVPKVSIEAVRNGFRVKVQSATTETGGGEYLVSTDGNCITWSVGCCGSAEATKPKKVEPAPRYVTPYGEYVFPDFAALSSWLRKNLTHGGGVTP